MALEDHIPAGEAQPPGDPSDARFWGYFWERDLTPWDIGEAHPEFRRRAELLEGEGEALVPGCGGGHDALLLCGLGWRVTAVDFASPPFGLDFALESSGGRFLAQDVFTLDEPGRYGLWLEHSFFCAIQPARRPEWGALAARSLAPGGLLAALVFPLGKDLADGGPPFGVTVEAMSEALGEAFELVLDEDVVDRIEDRGEAERFALWRRR